MSKLFTKIVKNRPYNQLDMCQGREQADFRKGFSTINQVFILNQLIEKAKEYTIDLYFLFVDFQKAFDTIDHNFFWGALKKSEI